MIWGYTEYTWGLSFLFHSNHWLMFTGSIPRLRPPIRTCLHPLGPQDCEASISQPETSNSCEPSVNFFNLLHQFSHEKKHLLQVLHPFSHPFSMEKPRLQGILSPCCAMDRRPHSHGTPRRDLTRAAGGAVDARPASDRRRRRGGGAEGKGQGLKHQEMGLPANYRN